MANDRTLLVTGASGHFGRRVLDSLLAAGTRSIIATTRYPDRLGDYARRGVVVRFADFDEPRSLPLAFAGAHRVLLISTNERSPERRRAQHGAAIEAAENACIEHLVYTSLARADASRLPLASDHVTAERRIAAARIDHTILRQNLFADVLVTTLPFAISSGILPSLEGDGGAAYISRDDCARAATRALLSCRGRQTFELTGPEVVRRAVLARIATQVTGRDVHYTAISPRELERRYADSGLPSATLFAYEQAIAEGQFSFTTSDYYRLTGHQPTTVYDYLVANRRSLVRAA